VLLFLCNKQCVFNSIFNSDIAILLRVGSLFDIIVVQIYLLSLVISPSAHRCSKSSFSRLTSFLTVILSSFAINRDMMNLEYIYHIIGFFRLPYIARIIQKKAKTIKLFD